MLGDSRLQSTQHSLIRVPGIAVALLVVILAGNFAQSPASAARVSPTAILGWTPGIARNVSPASHITIYFNRPMNHVSVEHAWQLSPATSGSFFWTGTAVPFHPASLWRAGQIYRVAISPAALSAGGSALATPFSSTFTVGDRLRVLSYSPLNRTSGVPPNGLISVTFSHPMVAR